MERIPPSRLLPQAQPVTSASPARVLRAFADLAPAAEAIAPEEMARELKQLAGYEFERAFASLARIAAWVHEVECATWLDDLYEEVTGRPVIDPLNKLDKSV